MKNLMDACAMISRMNTLLHFMGSCDPSDEEDSNRLMELVYMAEDIGKELETKLNKTIAK